MRPITENNEIKKDFFTLKSAMNLLSDSKKLLQKKQNHHFQ